MNRRTCLLFFILLEKFKQKGLIFYFDKLNKSVLRLCVKHCIIFNGNEFQKVHITIRENPIQNDSAISVGRVLFEWGFLHFLERKMGRYPYKPNSHWRGQGAARTDER
jgi:hypothetical protein